jgi:hypothetical protein
MEEKERTVVNIGSGEVFFLPKDKVDKLIKNGKIEWSTDYNVFIFDPSHLPYVKNDKPDGKYHILIFDEDASKAIDMIRKYTLQIQDNRVKGFNKLREDNILSTPLYKVEKYGDYYILLLPEHYGKESNDSLKELSDIIYHHTQRSIVPSAKVIFMNIFKFGIEFLVDLIVDSNYLSKLIELTVVDSIEKIIQIINVLFNKDTEDKKVYSIISILDSIRINYSKSRKGYIKILSKNYQVVLNEYNKHISFFNRDGKLFYSIDLYNEHIKDLFTPLVRKYKSTKNDIVASELKTKKKNFYEYVDRKSAKVLKNVLTFDTYFGMSVKIVYKKQYYMFPSKSSCYAIFNNDNKDKWIIDCAYASSLLKELPIP